MQLTDALLRLREESPEIAEMLNLYEETERVYHEALRAMGRESVPELRIGNSAQVTISLSWQQSLSTAGWDL